MKEPPVPALVITRTVLRSVERPFFRVSVTGYTTLSVLSTLTSKRNCLTESPPDHFNTVGLPACTDVGTVVKPSLDCARAATTKEAPMNRFFTKYIPNTGR